MDRENTRDTKASMRLLRVRQHAPPFEWYVSSESRRDKEYLVRLSPHGNSCDCAHFMFTILPKASGAMRGECKHIIAARAFALNYLIARMWAAMGMDKKTTSDS